MCFKKMINLTIPIPSLKLTFSHSDFRWWYPCQGEIGHLQLSGDDRNHSQSNSPSTIRKCPSYIRYRYCQWFILPKFNNKRPWKMMLGRRSFPFGMVPCQGRAVKLRGCTNKPHWEISGILMDVMPHRKSGYRRCTPGSFNTAWPSDANMFFTVVPTHGEPGISIGKPEFFGPWLVTLPHVFFGSVFKPCYQGKSCHHIQRVGS